MPTSTAGQTRAIAAWRRRQIHSVAQIVVDDKKHWRGVNDIMNQSLLAVIAFALPLSAVFAKAADGTFDHLTPPQLLTVEHAEILVPDDSSDAAEGYLTIWNGTQMQVALASVRSELFGRVTIVRTEFNSGDTNELPSGSVLPIPGMQSCRCVRTAFVFAWRNRYRHLGIRQLGIRQRAASHWFSRVATN
ncbi:hypothetical protein [Mesorhizobium australicum]|uniref:hypothetical protein n=1 Tax=Mesorhizobium australicum TaxID=536018 RepID=UPI000A1CEBAC|nr:hypothetical protein [Mesorhizobium australicum]